MIVQLEPGLLGPKLKPFQKRLDDMLASQGLDAATLTQRVRVVHAGKRHLALTNFETLAKATLERKQVQIEHLNRQNGEIVLREISPQQLVHYRDNWYVDAWCHLRGGVRSFSIDAIERALLLSKEAKDVDLISMRQQLDGGYGIFGGMPKDWAVLEFSPSRAQWVRHESWHPQQEGTLHLDGRYTLKVPYSDERELLGDILRFGAEVKVLAPPSLQQKIRNELSKALEQYKA
jgi:predicted DNA-binding transcriptional regulator YafY